MEFSAASLLKASPGAALRGVVFTLWDARPAWLRPGLWRKPLPELDRTLQPVVCLGELHTREEHAHIEVEALRALRPLGYDTLAVELPPEREPAARRYAASRRTEQDYRDFLHEGSAALYGDAFRRASAEGREKEIARQMEEPGERNTRILLNGAAELGYRLRFDDLSARNLAAIEEGGRLYRDLGRRNAASAAVLAEEARAGHGVVAVHGAAHLSEVVPGTSLKKELDRLGVPSRSFDLALDGERPIERVYRRLGRAPSPVDHVVSDGAEVGRILAREGGR
ncbi:MAG: hypothetical protein PW734_01955 [Verrucomicrobium sp.]|nr:hypothetical protein [Verrucomicrobium sp.]